MAEHADALQFAALPFRRGQGRLEIMLITSRETRRWVIPKGWPMADRTPAGAALQEAYEEAGLEGAIADQPFGAYRYLKQRPKAGDVTCRVEVFPLEVTGQLAEWPEQAQRETHWFAAEDAAEAVDEADLSALIRRFAAGV